MRCKRIPQPVGSEAVRADIQFLDLLLLGCGDIFLDDGLHRPIGVAHDPSKAARVVCDNGQQAEGSGIEALCLHQLLEGLAAQQGISA